MKHQDFKLMSPSHMPSECLLPIQRLFAELQRTTGEGESVQLLEFDDGLNKDWQQLSVKRIVFVVMLGEEDNVVWGLHQDVRLTHGTVLLDR